MSIITGYQVVCYRNGAGWNYEDDTIYATCEEAVSKLREALTDRAYAWNGVDAVDDAAVYEVHEPDEFGDTAGPCVATGHWERDLNTDGEGVMNLVIDGEVVGTSDIGG